MDICCEWKPSLLFIESLTLSALWCVSDTQGAVGFKGARRGTNFAGQEAGAEAARVSDAISLTQTPFFSSHVEDIDG